MGTTRFARKRDSIAAAMIFSLSATAYAAPENVIFAAENSLHGAGYDIGQADGWIDNDLRLAIKRFQSETQGLSNTGNLDAATLKALGIASEGGAVTDNALPSRKAALAALDLKPAAPSRQTSQPVVRAPQPEPEPRQEVREVVQPEPSPVESTPAPAEPDQTARVSPQPAQAPASTAPQEVLKPAPVAPAPTTAAPEVAVQAPASKPEPAPEAPAEIQKQEKPAAQVAVATQASPAPAPEDSPAEAPARTAGETNTTSAVEEESVDELQTAAVSSAVDNPQPLESGSGQSKPAGFFGTVFDLLFGWMI